MFFCSKVFCFGEFGSGILNSCVGICTEVFALQFTRKSVCPMMLRFTDSQRKLRHRLVCCRGFFFFVHVSVELAGSTHSRVKRPTSWIRSNMFRSDL